MLANLNYRMQWVFARPMDKLTWPFEGTECEKGKREQKRYLYCIILSPLPPLGDVALELGMRLMPSCAGEKVWSEGAQCQEEREGRHVQQHASWAPFDIAPHITRARNNVARLDNIAL